MPDVDTGGYPDETSGWIGEDGSHRASTKDTVMRADEDLLPASIHTYSSKGRVTQRLWSGNVHNPNWTYLLCEPEPTVHST